MDKVIKSPIFYMGNKFDLLPTISLYMPKKEEVEWFIDLFGGSGVVSANVPYNKITYNEINKNTYSLFNLFLEKEPFEIIKNIEEKIRRFDLKPAHKNFFEFREFYNKEEKTTLNLLVASYFSFCNILRFNSKGELNIPVGNAKFLRGEHDIDIINFIERLKNKKINTTNVDAFEFLENNNFDDKTFIYLDPPYTNTLAIYNEKHSGGWGVKQDLKLFNKLNELNLRGVKWAVSNVLENKGIKNEHIEKWANENGYKIISLEEKTYASIGKGNAKTQEVLIINYKAPFERFDIFDFTE